MTEDKQLEVDAGREGSVQRTVAWSEVGAVGTNMSRVSGLETN